MDICLLQLLYISLYMYTNTIVDVVTIGGHPNAQEQSSRAHSCSAILYDAHQAWNSVSVSGLLALIKKSK